MAKSYDIGSSSISLAVNEDIFPNDGFHLIGHVKHVFIRNYLQLQQRHFNVNALEEAYVNGAINLCQAKNCYKSKTSAPSHCKNLLLALGAVLACLLAGSSFAIAPQKTFAVKNKRAKTASRSKCKSHTMQATKMKFKNNIFNKQQKVFQFSMKEYMGLNLSLNSKMFLTLGVKNFNTSNPVRGLNKKRKTKGVFLRFKHTF